MSTSPSTSGCIPTFDSLGRPIKLTEPEIRERNLVALATLEAVAEIGDAAEQRETLDYLKRSVDDDRLSARPRFGP